MGAKADFFDGRLSASVAVFNLRDQNRPLSDTAHPGFVIPAGEVESQGWEAQVSGSPARGYEVQAGYARLDTEYLKANPNQQGLQFDLLEPRHSWKVWGVHRFEERLSGLTVGLGFNTQSGIRFDPKRGQGGFTVANAMLGYRLGEHATLDFNVSNLLDKVYYSRFGGTNSYNTFAEPRNYSLTFRARL
jgi:outer membrane receptor for ferric coprogen and ferric-rhodotorulic acid